MSKQRRLSPRPVAFALVLFLVLAGLWAAPQPAVAHEAWTAAEVAEFEAYADYLCCYVEGDPEPPPVGYTQWAYEVQFGISHYAGHALRDWGGGWGGGGGPDITDPPVTTEPTWDPATAGSDQPPPDITGQLSGTLWKDYGPCNCSTGIDSGTGWSAVEGWFFGNWGGSGYLWHGGAPNWGWPMGFSLQVSGGKIYAFWGDGNNAISTYSIQVANPEAWGTGVGQWHHIVVNRSESVFQLIVDGVLHHEQSVSFGGPYGYALHAPTYAGYMNFAGRNLAVYGLTALSPSQAQQHMDLAIGAVAGPYDPDNPRAPSAATTIVPRTTPTTVAVEPEPSTDESIWTLGSRIKGFLGTLGNRFLDGVGWLGDRVVNAVAAGANLIVGMLQAVYDGLRVSLQALGQVLTASLGALQTALQVSLGSIWSTLQWGFNLVGGAVNAVTGAVNAVVDAVTSLPNLVLDGLRALLQELFVPGPSTLGNLRDSWSTGVGTVVGSPVAAIDDAWSGFRSGAEGGPAGCAGPSIDVPMGPSGTPTFNMKPLDACSGVPKLVADKVRPILLLAIYVGVLLASFVMFCGALGVDLPHSGAERYEQGGLF